MFCFDGLMSTRSILSQTCNNFDMQKFVMHGRDRVHGWLASRVTICFVVVGLQAAAFKKQFATNIQ
jgi:hypothetical protein